MAQSLQSLFFSAREYLSPVLRESKFKEHGRITPDEFVAAGDFLVYKFPTWQWAAGEASKAKDYLPIDKQYLISRNVPCLRRVSSMVYTDADEDAEHMVHSADDSLDNEDEWVATHTNRAPQSLSHSVSIPSMDDIPDVSDAEADKLASQATGLHIGDSSTVTISDMDNIPDMDDDLVGSGGVQEVEDPAAQAAVDQQKASTAATSNLIQLRTYDCLITYDKYYQTPRMWLSGYDEHKKSLPPSLVFQDISSDYAQKTVTVESFPNLSNMSMATVHPCKHAHVMKKVIDRVNAGLVEAQRSSSGAGNEKERRKGGWGISGVVKKATGVGSLASKKEDPTSPTEDQPEGLRVDQYLLIFLKFMSSIMPTIEVDATASF